MTTLKEKGLPNGYAPLDASGKVPETYLPASQGGGSAWGEITGTLADQADLQAELDGKSDSGHGHAIADTTGLQAALDSKSDDGHDHSGVYEPADADIQTHIQSAHAPSDAQKNSDITKAEIEAVLTGEIDSHSHPSAGGGLSAAEVIDLIYPVGSIILTEDSENPGDRWAGTTWEIHGAGRVFVCLDSGDTDFDTVGETRGAKTHTLTVAEMPPHTHVQDAHTHIQNAHTHAQDAHSHVITSQTATTGGATSYEHGTLDTSSAENEATETTAATTATNQNTTAVNQNATAVNQNTGGGGAHNNIQPSIVGYRWKRTA